MLKEMQRLRGRSADNIDVQDEQNVLEKQMANGRSWALGTAEPPQAGYMTAGRAPASFWRKAVQRGGNLAGLMSLVPVEKIVDGADFGVNVQTLVDARAVWQMPLKETGSEDLRTPQTAAELSEANDYELLCMWLSAGRWKLLESLYSSCNGTELHLTANFDTEQGWHLTGFEGSEMVGTVPLPEPTAPENDGCGFWPEDTPEPSVGEGKAGAASGSANAGGSRKPEISLE
ncbi:unnamed protein product [Symbiodinium sp. KB8]|nr:unnamed protein product [Symbiodinium sp. KB8]